MSFQNTVENKALDLVRKTVRMTGEAGSGHPSSASSLAHLVAVLLYHQMRFDPSDPEAPSADRLVLSEGHACPILYAAGADLGFPVGKHPGNRRRMTMEDALGLRSIDSEIDGHPNPAEGFPFFPAATGSLGQGLSISLGLALGARLDDIDRRVYCFIGDGESREGQIWEALDFLVDHEVTEVLPVFNCNGHGQSDRVSAQQSPEVLQSKLEAIGITALVIDGHDPVAIMDAFEQHASVGSKGRPVAVVARTRKGWGLPPDMQGHERHGKPLPEEEEQEALDRLDRRIEESRGSQEFRGPKPPVPRSTATPAPETPSSFEQALGRYGTGDLLEDGKLATRKAFGLALRSLGHTDPRVVVLDADVGGSTHSGDFAKDEELGRRFFQCRIAEQNMMSVAGGLAKTGRIPFVCTFGKFLMRACDQFEMGLISRFNLKLVGSHTGVTLAADGPSQMALADVGFFGTFTRVRDDEGNPVLHVLNPSDAYSTYTLTMAMAAHDGACYLRTVRPDVPFLYNTGTDFPLGKFQVVSGGQDLVLAATGYMVHEAMEAAKELRKIGINPTVVDLYCLPFDEEALRTVVRENNDTVLTLEDNYGGGFGAAVAEALARGSGEFTFSEMNVSRIPKSGRKPWDVLRSLGLFRDDIVLNAMNLLEHSPIGTGGKRP